MWAQLAPLGDAGLREARWLVRCLQAAGGRASLLPNAMTETGGLQQGRGG